MGMVIDLDVKPASTTPDPASRARDGIGALIMDADYRALAVVRSLGRRGIPVWVLRHGDQMLATFSRYNRRTLSWPSQDEEEKETSIIDLPDGEKVRDWVWFPTGL